MFDDKFKIVEKAVKSAEASVGLESNTKNSIGLEMIYEALRRAQNNGSFFEELVKIEKEKILEEKEKGGSRHGQR